MLRLKARSIGPRPRTTGAPPKRGADCLGTPSPVQGWSSVLVLGALGRLALVLALSTRHAQVLTIRRIGDHVRAVGPHHVGAVAAGDRVRGPAVAATVDSIVARAAVERVSALAALQAVVALAAVQRVVALAAVEAVVAVAPLHLVISSAGLDLVVAALGVDLVSGVRALQLVGVVVAGDRRRQRHRGAQERCRRGDREQKTRPADHPYLRPVMVRMTATPQGARGSGVRPPLRRQPGRPTA